LRGEHARGAETNARRRHECRRSRVNPAYSPAGLTGRFWPERNTRAESNVPFTSTLMSRMGTALKQAVCECPERLTKRRRRRSPCNMSVIATRGCALVFN
jgi:hypothetical protein